MIDLQLPSNILIAGSTRSGKTHLTKKILDSGVLAKTDYLIIFSPTANISGDWDKYRLNDNPKYGRVIQIFDDVSAFNSILMEMISSQKELLKHHSKNEIPSIIIILDDCLNTNILRQRGLIDQFSVSSRHYNMSMFILVQKIRGAPKTLRLNCAYFILFSCSNFLELQTALEEFVPRKFRKNIEKHIVEIYNIPYNYILCDCFNPRMKDRLRLNGEEYLIHKFENDE